MKIKFILLLIITILIGFLSSKIVYAFNNKKVEKKYNAYILQIGPLKESDIKKEVSGLDYYIAVKKNNLNYIYSGISTKVENIKKIKDIYKSKSSIKIRKSYINNKEFITNLEQYDLLIDGLSNKKDILSVNKVILSSYEDLILR